MRKPPVGPNSTGTPPRKPEKTGSPKQPINIYNKVEKSPSFAGSVAPITKITNSESVIGMAGVGMLIGDRIHKMAVNRLVTIKWFVFSLIGMIIPPFQILWLRSNRYFSRL